MFAITKVFFKKVAIKRVASLSIITAALTTTMTGLSGCTAHQQDALFAKVTELGRDKAGLEKHQVETLDIEMTYLERKADGPVIMLVHGFSANKDTWLRFADYLPDNYHIIAPDLAGHGESEKADSYDLEAQADRLNPLCAWHYLDLIAHRDYSNLIAQELGINHESPQLIILHLGEVIWHDSHQGITPEAVMGALSTAQD
ncbi:MAG: alpha/beta fold hydrolase [Thalassolituus sp.]